MVLNYKNIHNLLLLPALIAIFGSSSITQGMHAAKRLTNLSSIARTMRNNKAITPNLIQANRARLSNRIGIGQRSIVNMADHTHRFDNKHTHLMPIHGAVWYETGALLKLYD